jgi:Predicted transcriptional regulators
MNLENTKAQLRKGALELVVLSIIRQEGEAYPSDILNRLKEAELLVVEGTLYPLLNRLKTGGLLDYQWRESQSGPPRKYYNLSEAGQSFLDELHASWRSLVEAVDSTTKSFSHHE